MDLNYEAGMTMDEIKHSFSYWAVCRALHPAGVKMRAKAPRPKVKYATTSDKAMRRY